MDQFPPPPPPPPPGPVPGGSGIFTPRGIADILSAAFDLYRENSIVLWQIVAVVVVPLTIIQYFLTNSLFAVKKQTVEAGKAVTITIQTTSFGRAVFLALVAALIATLAVQILTGAISRAAAGSLIGQALTVGGALEYGVARLWSILLVGLLVGLAVVAGLILLVIPGIIVGVMFSVALPALVVEGKRGTEAMRRSWTLVAGHFWHVLGAYVVAFLITWAVNAILGSLFNGWFLSGIAASVGSILTTPFTALVAMLIYVDVRVRTEGLTVERLRVDLEASAP